MILFFSLCVMVTIFFSLHFSLFLVKNVRFCLFLFLFLKAKQIHQLLKIWLKMNSYPILFKWFTICVKSPHYRVCSFSCFFYLSHGHIYYTETSNFVTKAKHMQRLRSYRLNKLITFIFFFFLLYLDSYYK